MTTNTPSPAPSTRPDHAVAPASDTSETRPRGAGTPDLPTAQDTPSTRLDLDELLERLGELTRLVRAFCDEHEPRLEALRLGMGAALDELLGPEPEETLAGWLRAIDRTSAPPAVYVAWRSLEEP